MKIFATFDDDGFPLGFWNDVIFPDELTYGAPEDDDTPPVIISRKRNKSIPDGAAEISSGQYDELLQHQGFRRWDGQNVIPYLPPEQPVLMPDLAPYQFRAMLKLSGKQDQLYAFMAALPEPSRTVAQSKLEYSLTFKRDNDLVLGAQSALGLTNVEMDTLWLQAASIE